MLKKLTDRIFYLPGEDITGRDRPFLYYVRGDRKSLAVDAGNSPAHVNEFYGALRAAGLRLPDLTVVTHWHWDHSFGLSAAAGLTAASAAANEKLRRAAAWRWDPASIEKRLETGEDIEACAACIRREYGDPEAVRVIPAEMELAGELTVDLGGVSCQILRRDSPHSRDGLFVYVPEERALAVGDGESGDYYDNGGQYDPKRLRAFIQFLSGLDYRWALGGHGEPWEKTEELALLKDRLKEAEHGQVVL